MSGSGARGRDRRHLPIRPDAQRCAQYPAPRAAGRSLCVSPGTAGRGAVPENAAP